MRPFGLPESFTTGQAAAAGLASTTLYRLRDRGEVVELSRGVWRWADAAPTAYESLLAVTLRAPHGTVCLVSALAVHELTDEIPAAVDLAVARGTTRPQVSYPPVIVHVFEADTFELRRDQVEIAPGEHVPVYDPARSVVDALRLRHQVGVDIAYGALRRLLAGRRGAVRDVLDVARTLDGEGPSRAALEVLQASASRLRVPHRGERVADITSEP